MGHKSKEHFCLIRPDIKMKIDLEPLLDILEERRYEDRDESFVVCELKGHFFGIRPLERYLYLDSAVVGSDMGEWNDMCRRLEAAGVDMGIVFQGRASLRSIMMTHVIADLLETGCVKAIRAGHHFDELSPIELLDIMEFYTVQTLFSMILNRVRHSIEELLLMKYAVNESMALHLANGFGNLTKVENLALYDMGCSEIAFTHLVRGLASSMNNLRYLNVARNSISQEVASVLKEVIRNHPKLVFLNVGHCEMDLHSLDLILDGCEITRQMQSMVVESTVASSVGGMNSIERRLRSGSLCLLNIKFHDRDNVDEFIQRIRSYMARNYAERKNIELLKNNKLHRLELPEALESIVCSPDGVENMYKLLIADHSHLLDLFKVKEY
jgi:hypothetical protein